MNIDEIADQLQEFSALSSLNENQILGLAQSVQFTRYRSGSWLCREGDEGNCAYFLLSGSVSISKQLKDGRKVYLSTLTSGHLFGQTGLIPGQSRTADVTATSEVEILVLDRTRLDAALQRRDSWASGLQTLIASHLVRQLRGALARLETLANQEDAETEAEGRKHSDVVQPTSLKVDFGAPRKPRSPSPAESRSQSDTVASGPSEPPQSDHGEWEALPPVTADNTREELYELLQATEAGLGGGTDYQLQTVRVVVDDDDWGRTMKPR